MGKLIFTYGTMGSAKTANALMRYFEFKNDGKYVALLKPAIDERDGKEIIKSRIGLEETALTFLPTDNFHGLGNLKGLQYLVLDEAQFCTEQQITVLKDLAVRKDIDIYCYGLLTDFTSHLFEGSKRLIELADELRPLEKRCCKCGANAQINARIDENKNIIYEGEQVELGKEESYCAVCYKCWKDNKLKKDKE